MQVINIDTWERKEHYNFFRGLDYPQYNICMNIDITNFIDKIKQRKLPFYYAMTYAATKVLNSVDAFKYRIREGQVVLYDQIDPSFTELVKETELFKIVTVPMQDTIEEFVQLAKQKSEEQKEYFPFQNAVERDDVTYITCIPWITFTQLTHPISLNKEESVPRISWGKYDKDGDRILLPFSLQVHHSLVDGVHVGKYVTRLQEYLNEFEKKD